MQRARTTEKGSCDRHIRQNFFRHRIAPARFCLLHTGTLRRSHRQHALSGRTGVQSLFLPPIVGILTVPTGLNPNITYNLVSGKQE